MKRLTLFCWLILILCSVAPSTFGQSQDISFPSPVRTSEVVGSIAALDIGDARRTNHFYTFVGNPGDVLVTVQSNNLNGDIDVFTAGSLRPLMKFALYAESTAPITKSVYLRRRQELVLRVEARTPNDDEGTYQIRFGGSFEPLIGEALVAANESPTPEPSPEPTLGRNTKRVSSVGARLPEPPRPVEDIAAATPTPEPTPEEPKPIESPASVREERAAETESRATRRTRGGRIAPTRRTARPSTRTEDPAAKPDEPTTVTETKTETTTSERPTARRGARKQAEPQQPEPLSGPRLIIEMQDGTRIERYMSTVKRVTVENNQIVVVNKLGRIERVRLSEVTRMSIEP
ncbi:MAG TPA: hypothetical protein VJM12_14105 [Pyrinomonadaceae bacterium]|nr:hypothetical protein [Pyrinomonadaceae bacterium]